jgi:hypothetical protein
MEDTIVIGSALAGAGVLVWIWLKGKEVKQPFQRETRAKFQPLGMPPPPGCRRITTTPGIDSQYECSFTALPKTSVATAPNNWFPPDQNDWPTPNPNVIISDYSLAKSNETSVNPQWVISGRQYWFNNYTDSK